MSDQRISGGSALHIFFSADKPAPRNFLVDDALPLVESEFDLNPLKARAVPTEHFPAKVRVLPLPGAVLHAEVMGFIDPGLQLFSTAVAGHINGVSVRV
jgi:hypothetical protein